MNNYELDFESHYYVGGNPKDIENGFSDTPEEAVQIFAQQFEELLKDATGKFLFVRRPPKLEPSRDFSTNKTFYRMVGRFSIVNAKSRIKS